MKIGERTGLMKRRIAIAALALVLVVASSCGHGSTRDPVADARVSLDRVQRATVHMQLELAGSGSDPTAQAGFATDGTFDLAPKTATAPAVDVMTMNLGLPDAQPAHFVSTGQQAFIVKGDVGYQLGFVPKPTRPMPDLGRLLVDPTAQTPISTAAGETVDRVTAHADPVDAVNGAVDLAEHLGAGPDPALRISPSDADRVRGATTSSNVEVLTGRDDHLLRKLTAHIELTAPTPPGPIIGGALVQALHKLGHVTVSVELRLDDPNVPVAVSPPATIRPFSELGNG